MALDAKYGKLDIPGIPEDEPVFVLRARDTLAGSALNFYYTLAEESECSDDVLNGVEDAEKVFADWAATNELRLPA